MPVSKELNCVFIHIPKTAGTAMEAALGMHGEIDYIGKKLYRNQTKDFQNFFGGGLQHLTALQLSNCPDLPLSFESAFKFTFVRNPWDRIISALAFDGSIENAKIEKPTNFYEKGVKGVYEKFRRGELRKDPHYRLQIDYILNDDGECLVDFVGRFEELSRDWKYVIRRIGVVAKLELRMVSRHSTYVDLLTQELREIVAEIYREDIQFLEYRFSS